MSVLWRSVGLRGSFARPDAPVRVRRPGEVIRMKALTSRWWSTPPLGFNAVVEVPVEQLEVVESADRPAADQQQQLQQQQAGTGKMRLPGEIFNTPIRKDVVHGIYWGERRARAGYQEQLQLYKWEWPGSNRKARPALNAGLPKMGRRKAPGKWDGSFARPVRAVDLRQKLGRRVVLQALRSVLTGKFAEKNFHVVENFHTTTHKTKHIRTHLRRIVGPRTARLLIVHDAEDICDNFRWGCANIPGVRRELVERVTPLLLLEHRKVLLSRTALEKLVQRIQNFPAKCGWGERFATPDGRRAPRPQPVSGWNAEWLARRRQLQNSDFRLQEFWRRDRTKQWRWSSELHGPLRVPRFDDLAGFRLLDFGSSALPRGSDAATAGRFELQELYTDAEDLEP